MRATLGELAALIEGHVVGDPCLTIWGMNSLEQAQPGELAFIAGQKYASRLPMSQAAAVLVDDILPVDRPAIRVAYPYASFIRLLEHFFPLRHPQWEVHALAVIASGVALGQGVKIGPYVVIEQGARLGDGVIIYPGTYIGEECELGANCVLYANVSLYARVSLGHDVIIHSGAVIGADGFGFQRRPDGSHQKIPQAGRVRIGNAVEIGANTCIDRATVGDTIIEDGVKLDNLVQIGHNSIVGANTVVAGQAGLSGSVHVGTGVRIAGQVGIADHMAIGDGATLLAQSGVTSDVAPEAMVFGTPAIPRNLARRQHVYSLKLGELFQQVKQLQRRVEELEGRENTP